MPFEKKRKKHTPEVLLATIQGLPIKLMELF
jgi:hypothetical protein